MFEVLTLLCLMTQGPEAPRQTGEDRALEARHLKNVRQVTFAFPRAGEGYFSPDGTKIIFQAYPPTEPSILWDLSRDGYQIYLAELKEGSSPKLVSTGEGRCTCAYFHPDGQSILFASTHLEAEESTRPKGPAYSRSERYRWDFPESMDIFRADLDGGNLVRLTDTPGYDAEASYSPDGRKIVFTSFRDGDAEIYIMDADGTNPRRITRSPGYDGGPFFSPDGNRIIYRSDRKDNDLLQIFVNNTEGTDERQLTQDQNVNWGPYFHPDGRHIVYATSEHGHSNYEIYLMDIETGEKARITHHDGFDGLPVFSPDGKQLMWTSSGRTDDRRSQLFLGDFCLEPSEDPTR